MKLGQIKLLSFADVALGEGRVRAFTLFEWKRLGSIIFYKWETIDQVRFHTHAFAAWAFLLWGAYEEEVIEEYGGSAVVTRRRVDRKLVPRWIPRNYCHAIKRSFGFTMTVVFTGPWQRTWWEYFPDKRNAQWGGIIEREGYWQEYGWGRKKLRRVEGDVRAALDMVARSEVSEVLHRERTLP